LIGCNCCYEILGIDFLDDPDCALNKEQNAEWERILGEKGFIPYGKETRFERFAHKHPNSDVI